jgi:sugar transferase EpsL
MNRQLQLKLKRLFDVAAAATALVLLSPLIGGIALAVRATMGRPILFRQLRLGYRGQPFTILKFRSMTAACDQDGRLLPDGQRLTVVGRLLRSLTLDELPELFNVVRGDMSLVGPRPLLVDYRDLYRADQWRRHDMPPGMAGPVLARGRNTLTWDQKFALDIDYVDHWSLHRDAAILLQTAWKVVTREGVSATDHATMPRYTGSEASLGGESP